MLKILIVDDHPLLRKGLIQLLNESISVSQVIETGCGDSVINLINNHKIDVLILDISLPGKDGMVLLGDVHMEYPELPVLMLSIQPEEQYAARAFKLGAKGCLNKASAPEELVEAVKKVASGGTYISETTGNILLKNINRDLDSEPHQLLSERETQVMLKIAAGKTTTEIAEELNISVKTVSTYRSRLLEKMNLRNNSQLTQYAYSHKLMLIS